MGFRLFNELQTTHFARARDLNTELSSMRFFFSIGVVTPIISIVV